MTLCNGSRASTITLTELKDLQDPELFELYRYWAVPYLIRCDSMCSVFVVISQLMRLLQYQFRRAHFQLQQARELCMSRRFASVPVDQTVSAGESYD